MNKIYKVLIFIYKILGNSNKVIEYRIKYLKCMGVAIGDNLNHAVYKSWKDSVKDRLIYEAIYLHKLKNKEEYYEYLDRTYAKAGGKKYSDLIKQIIKQNNL